MIMRENSTINLVELLLHMRIAWIHSTVVQTGIVYRKERIKLSPGYARTK